MKKHLLFIFVLLIIVVLACATKQNEKQAMDQLQKAISENDNAWNNLDIDKIAGMFAENGTLLNNNSEMVRGKEAIIKSFKTTEKIEKVEFKRDKIEVSLKGNIAYEIVNQTVSIQYPDKEPQTILNKYIHIWEQQKDGSWKVLIDMNNSRTSSDQ
jgi:uncharacterized protein (TIGR02246 family)